VDRTKSQFCSWWNFCVSSYPVCDCVYYRKRIYRFEHRDGNRGCRTALLLAAVSATIEQYIKAKLSDQEVNTALKCRELGIQNLEERSLSRSIGLDPPTEILNACRSEVLVIAYSADNFIERNESWVREALDNGKSVGLLILHPEQLEQANQTENQRDIFPQINKPWDIAKKS